jgi:hypothetical protein
VALEIFKLFGSIYVDNEKANESIAKTDNKAQGIGKTLLNGIGTAAKWGAGIATAAAGGVAALTGLATKVADTAGAIDDSAQKTGLTAENYQKYAYAAKLSGIETEKLDSILVKSQKSFADAQTGSKGLQEAYQKLGIDINSISNSSDAFDATINALASMTDETQRNALANDIFGKSYADMAPLLNAGAAGIAQLKQEAVDMGAVMSNDAVAAGANFGDTIDKIKMAAGGLFNSLAVDLIPIAQQFADIIIANMPMIQQLFGQLAPVIALLFSNLLPPLIELVQTLMPTIISLFNTILPIVTEIINMVLPVFTELLGLLLPPLIQIVEAVLPPLLEIIQAIMPILKTVIEVLKPIIELFTALIGPIIDLVMSAVTPLVNVLADLINTILKPFIPLIKDIAKIVTNVLGTAFKDLQPIIDNITGIFTGLIDFISGVFTGNWEKAFKGLKDIVSNIFDALINIVKTPINWIIKGLNAFIGGLNKLKIPDWVPGIGGKGINIPEIPMLAEGGEILSAGRVLVGEKGPEFLDLPKGAKVTPLEKAKETIKEILINLTLHIENFNNNTHDDLEELSNELAFLIKRKMEGGGNYDYA